MKAELDRNVKESVNLTNSKKDLEKALKETEAPLGVTNECILRREKRKVHHHDLYMSFIRR